MIAGLFVVVGGLVVVALIANSGRISSQAGSNLLDTTFQTQKRSACITDLRNVRDNYAGEVSDAVINRLAVLDGFDPRTSTRIPQVLSPTKGMVADPNLSKVLSYRYVLDGLKARDNRIKAANLLKQPKLNQLCGKPITDQGDLKSKN